MLKESHYFSPKCTVENVCTEGVICASVDEVDAQNTEMFDPLNDFQW
jgi:hypothetical protein